MLIEGGNFDTIPLRFYISYGMLCLRNETITFRIEKEAYP